MDIYIPRSVINLITMYHDKGVLTNPSVCVRFQRKQFEVSLALDSSLGKNDLRRGEIRVYQQNNDVTDKFMFLFPDCNLIVGSVDNLMTIINHIDNNE